MSAQERYRFIRSEMVKRGITIKSFSEEAGVSRQRVSDVFRGKSAGYRIRQALAKKCQLPVEYFWPDTPQEHRKAA